jgi:threonine dehydratase
LNIRHSVTAAEGRIRGYIRETPLEYSFPLSESTGSNVFLKLENLQFTGSFKPRGAVNKLLTLTAEERARGVLTASTGNHGLALAYGARQLGIRSTIYLPENTSPQKLDMLRHYDADLRFHGSEFGEAELYAREESRRNGTVFVSAYNDEQVIAGQGTIAVELQRQMDHIDVILVSVGGGGLIAGIAGFLKETNAETRTIGCLPENSPVMFDSIQAGRIVESQVLPTLSDGTSGGIEPEAITFGLCQQYVDDWILVDENEIRQAMKLVFEQHRLVIEGSAAVSVASLLKAKGSFKGNRDTNVVLIICGGNVDVGQFKQLVF